MIKEQICKPVNIQRCMSERVASKSGKIGGYYD